jgi:hypothetical protein
MSQAPENPTVGQTWYDASVTPTGALKMWDGSSWVVTEWQAGYPGLTPSIPNS